MSENQPNQPNRKQFAIRTVIAVMLLAIAATAGVTYAIVTLTTTTKVTVNEPLIITSPSQTASFFAGESTSLTFTVADLSSVNVPAKASIAIAGVNCTPVPPSSNGCSPDQLSVTSVDVGGVVATQDSTTGLWSMTFLPGANNLNLGISSTPSTVAGDYSVTITVTR